MWNILITDDQPYLRELFSQELVDEGYDVEGVPNAESVMMKSQLPPLETRCHNVIARE